MGRTGELNEDLQDNLTSVVGKKRARDCSPSPLARKETSSLVLVAADADGAGCDPALAGGWKVRSDAD